MVEALVEYLRSVGLDPGLAFEGGVLYMRIVFATITCALGVLLIAGCGGREWRMEPYAEEVTDSERFRSIRGLPTNEAVDWLEDRDWDAKRIATLHGNFLNDPTAEPPRASIRVYARRELNFWRREALFLQVDEGGRVVRIYNRFTSTIPFP